MKKEVSHEGGRDGAGKSRDCCIKHLSHPAMGLGDFPGRDGEPLKGVRSGRGVRRESCYHFCRLDKENVEAVGNILWSLSPGRCVRQPGVSTCLIIHLPW